MEEDGTPQNATTVAEAHHTVTTMVEQSPAASPDLSSVMVSHHHFNPPDAVRNWLTREDMASLAKAWEDAEAKAVAWAEADEWDDEDMWPGDGSSSVTPSLPSIPAATPTPKRRSKAPWQPDFHLLGQDTGATATRRRYFGKECSDRAPGCPPSRLDPIENEVWKPNKPSVESSSRSLASRSLSTPLASLATENRKLTFRENRWATNAQTVSEDNPVIHPFLRHFFDRRGLESSFRQRPELNKVYPVYRPRTPQRPTIEDLIMKQSKSAPALPGTRRDGVYQEDGDVDIAARSNGNTCWSKRTLLYGQDYKARSSSGDARIPWVDDWTTQVSEDNPGLNPLNRHYFDTEGLESSYRNRGHDSGRPKRNVFGYSPTPSNCRMSVTSPVRKSQEQSQMSAGGRSTTVGGPSIDSKGSVMSSKASSRRRGGRTPKRSGAADQYNAGAGVTA